MKKIMFNDHYGLTQAVLDGRKTMTRRIVPNGTPLGNWEKTENKLRYKTGDVVAVAQRYKKVMEEKGENGVSPLVAKAGYMNKMFVKAKLMPHIIRITDIHIERLQDISDEDCIKEGIIPYFRVQSMSIKYYVPNFPKFDFTQPRDAFTFLIDKVSGKGTWERNPFVFVYSFELVK